MTTGDLVHTYSSTVACAACGSGDMGEGTQYGCLIARVSFGTGIDRVTHKPEYKHTYSPDKPCPVCLSFGYACPNNGCDVNPNGPTPWCEVNQDGKSIDEIMGPLDAIRDLQSETVFLRAMEASNADKIKELEKRIEALVDGESHTYNWFGACPECCRNGGILPSLAVGCALAPKSQIEKLKQKLGKGEWDEMSVAWNVALSEQSQKFIKSITDRLDALESKNKITGHLKSNYNWYIKDEVKPENWSSELRSPNRFRQILWNGHIDIDVQNKSFEIEINDGIDHVSAIRTIEDVEELHKALGEAIEFMRRGDAKGGS